VRNAPWGASLEVYQHTFSAI